VTVPRLQSEDLSVGRLRLRAPEWAPEARRALARELARGLERADWPRAAGDDWVLVRRLAVTATRAAAPARTRAALAERLARAADAGSPEAERAAAVRFRDLPDLLAHLAADLVAGRAAERWYWRRWSELLRLSPAEALVRLLGDHAERLGTVTERLAGQGALAPVWNTLSPAQAWDLQGRVSARLGMPLPGPSAAEDSPDLALPPPPQRLRERWAPALAGLARQDPRRRLAACLTALEWRPLWLADDRAGLILAALGDGLSEGADPRAQAGRGSSPVGAAELPAVQSPGPPLRRPPGAGEVPWSADRGPRRLRPSIPGLERQADGPWSGRAGGPRVGPSGLDPSPGPRMGGPTGSGRGPAPGPAPHGSVEAGALTGPTPRPGSVPAGSPPGGAATVSGGGLAQVAGPNRDGTPVGHGGRTRWGGDPGPHLSRSTPAADPPSAFERECPRVAGPAPAAPTPPRSLADPGPGPGESPVWETLEGGLFYLLNFLARPEAQALLRPERPANTPIEPSDGWAWLADLGLRLGLAPDGSLARFLAERLELPLGPDRPRPLADLPELPAGPVLLDLGARLYGGDSVWTPDLLRVPARIHLSATHLDIDYPLWAVRLEVRLVALDLNPGWLPWLGRVVTFRYLDAWSGPGARHLAQGGAPS
jgi:hypothetical protein